MKTNLFKALIAVLFISIVGGCSSAQKAARPTLEPKQKTPQEVNKAYRAYRHYVSGLLFEYAGQTDYAKREYERALTIEPKSLEINYALASLYFRQRLFKEAYQLRHNIENPDAEFSLLMGELAMVHSDDSTALEYFRTAAEKDPDNYSAHKSLASHYLNYNQPDSAQPHLERMVELNPMDVQAASALGQLLTTQGQYDSATVLFERVLEIYPNHKGASAGLAAIYQETEQPEKALEIYNRIIEEYPEDILFYSMKINTELSLGMTDKALKTGMHVLGMEPDNRQFLLSVVQLQIARENFAEAESLLSKYLEHKPEDSGVKLLLGRIYTFNEKYSLAQTILQSIIAEEDTLGEAYLLLASNYLRQDMTDSSISILQNAIPKVQQKDVMYHQIGNIYNSRRHYPQAIQYYRKAVGLNPDDPGHKIALAEVHDSNGDFNEAEDILRDLIKQYPDNATALNNLAYMYINQERKLDDAEKYLERALELEPQNGAFLDSYGWLMFKKGKTEKAISYIRDAMDVIGADPELFDHMGDIYRHLGEFEKSQEYYSKALELVPDNENIREKLNSLPLSKGNE
ncbi:MAG: tetratricopeptide repeat protein [candidate division Zixibacteria bacterium]|nr:tetratricopeptide repeat protein [candidate division Zixibacteria bacterium]